MSKDYNFKISINKTNIMAFKVKHLVRSKIEIDGLILEQVKQFNPLKRTGYVTHHQFNIQQLYALPTHYFMCFVFISEKTATCATYVIN